MTPHGWGVTARWCAPAHPTFSDAGIWGWRVSVCVTKLSILIATTTIGATFACGGPPDDSAASARGIIEGNASAVSDFPSAGVMLVTESDESGDGGGMACTGTLIAPDVVLTAAHCLVDQAYIRQEYPGLTVRSYFSFELDVSQFGVANLDLPPGAQEIVKQVGHPQYGGDGDPSGDGDDGAEPPAGLGNDRDIALLFLKAPVAGGQPVALIRKEDRPLIRAGAAVQIAGYGQRERKADSNQAGTKFHGDTFIREVNEGEMQVGGLADTADRGPSKCYGDSGGPTYMDVGGVRRVIGVTSRSYNNHDDCDTAGIDTRVDPFLDWIAAEIAKACAEGVSKSCNQPTPTEPTPAEPAPVEPAPTKPEPKDPAAPSKPSAPSTPSSGFKAQTRGPQGCSSSSGADLGALWLFGLAGVLYRRRR